MTVETPKQRSLLGKLLRLAAGTGLLIIGIIGLILPIMPGWIFVIPGLLILADFFPPIHRLVTWAKGKLEEEMEKRGMKKPGA